jgi:uncharacterized glyoxalase superfamily protein PhnB
MTSLSLGGISLVLDLSDDDSAATIALESHDCDHDYQTLVSRGAESLEEPIDQSWGVRTAYVKGPGAILLELEQPLT